MSTAYLAFDLHANTTTFGWMDAEGTYRDENTFDTSASRMIRHVADVPANKTVCTVEGGPLAGWAARTLTSTSISSWCAIPERTIRSAMQSTRATGLTPISCAACFA
jgi:hypothetical protein